MPGIGGVVELIRQHYRSEFPDAVAAFEQYIATSGVNQYQAAFRHLNGRGGLEDANRIVRQAVLHAYAGSPVPDANDRKACERAESMVDAWPLSPWVEALGELLKQADGRRLDPLILTTNFDPFLSVSVRRSGGTTYRSVLDRDGNLGQVSGDGCHVVHLHGHWCIGDTLHTPTQLATERRGLKESIRRLLANKTLVVLGYGGWDDIFTSALIEALQSSQDRIELLWLFREARADAETKYAPLLGRLRAGYERGEVALYDGIDLCSLLPALRDRMRVGSSAPPSASGASGAGGAPLSRPEDSPPHSADEVLGRREQKTALLGACQNKQAVQILGLPSSGKTWLLRWVRWVAPVGWKIAEVRAGGLAGQSPKDLVMAIAAASAQLSAATTGFAAHAAVSPARAAERVLRSLLPLVVLVDDADKLADQHSFDAGFFDELRSQCQERKLWWVSASQDELASLFQKTGLTSRFLNDSLKVSVGSLEPDALLPLLQGLRPEQSECVLQVGGCLPLETRWLADWMRREPIHAPTAIELSQRASDALLMQMQTTFASRWRKLKRAEQTLLRRCTEGPIAYAGLADHERTWMLKLHQQGVVMEGPSGYVTNGTAWGRFVRGPHGR
ncbi:MAG: SIR2 family protein [Myxococcales bacterium]|nr:SIR2 family protein [Myxococcales bacterium]